jgi:hypothetical protein
MLKELIAIVAWAVNLTVMFMGLLEVVPIDLLFWFCFIYSLVVASVASIKLPTRRRKM